MNSFSDIANFIWQVADLLRGPYRPNQYKDVMLPLVTLRRLDCVLEPTKDKVMKKLTQLKVAGRVRDFDVVLNREAEQEFHNISPYTFTKLKADPDHIAKNLTLFIKGFSSHAREIRDH